MDDPPRLDEGQLYTLAEAARLTGLTVDALRKRIVRRRLASVRSNDGMIRVRLDAAAMATLKDGRDLDIPHSRLSGPTEEQTSLRSRADQAEGAVAGLREALAAAREAHARERERADQAETRASAAAGLAERRGEELTAALVRAAGAEGEIKALREALADARQPFWRRWLGPPAKP